jgi:hypothetical protein
MGAGKSGRRKQDDMMISQADTRSIFIILESQFNEKQLRTLGQPEWARKIRRRPGLSDRTFRGQFIRAILRAFAERVSQSAPSN